MKVELSKRAIKFLQQLEEAQQKRIQLKIIRLKDSLERQQTVPFNELDIKKLKGNWHGFLRLRSGKCRIIFTVNLGDQIIYIYDICFRGNAYD